MKRPGLSEYPNKPELQYIRKDNVSMKHALLELIVTIVGAALIIASLIIL